MDVVMNVPTTSLADAGVAGTTFGYAARFQNNVIFILKIRFNPYFKELEFFMGVLFWKV